MRYLADGEIHEENEGVEPRQAQPATKPLEYTESGAAVTGGFAYVQQPEFQIVDGKVFGKLHVDSASPITSICVTNTGSELFDPSAERSEADQAPPQRVEFDGRHFVAKADGVYEIVDGVEKKLSAGVDLATQQYYFQRRISSYFRAPQAHEQQHEVAPGLLDALRTILNNYTNKGYRDWRESEFVEVMSGYSSWGDYEALPDAVLFIRKFILDAEAKK